MNNGAKSYTRLYLFVMRIGTSAGMCRYRLSGSRRNLTVRILRISGATRGIRVSKKILLPPVEFFHVLRAECTLGLETIVPRAQQPEVVRIVRAALGEGNYMIYLEIFCLRAPPSVFAYISTPAAVSDEYFVTYFLRDVAGAGDGAAPGAAAGRSGGISHIPTRSAVDLIMCCFPIRYDLSRGHLFPRA